MKFFFYQDIQETNTVVFLARSLLAKLSKKVTGEAKTKLVAAGATVELK